MTRTKAIDRVKLPANSGSVNRRDSVKSILDTPEVVTKEVFESKLDRNKKKSENSSKKK